MSETTGNNGYSPYEKPHTGSLDEKLNQMHSERREEYGRADRGGYGNDDDDRKKKRNRNILIGILAVVGVVILGGCAWLILADMGEKTEQNAADGEDGQADDLAVKELQLQLAASEFENLDREFEQLETQREIIVDDSIKIKLTQQYESAKLEVERLRKELQASKNMSAKEIKALNDQIKTLRELIKHYLEEIDRLNKENEELRAQNEDLSQRLQQTSSNLEQTQREREHLAERMTLAEKLNVTGVSMNMLNKKDKSEKKIKNAKKFVISFTIPQNNSTPVGTKTIYAVITTPEGQLLDGAGTFAFEGGNVTASARRTVDYGGEEIGGVTMYYDIRNALTPGTYTVQLFCDGYALCNPQSFTFK